MRMTAPSHSSSGSLFVLLRPFWGILALCAVFGTLGGFSVTGLLAVVNRGLHAGPDQQYGLLLAFAGLCLLVLIGSIVSDVGTNTVGQKVIATLRKSLAAKILAAPIDQLERYRAHRLIPVLTHDVDTISDFAFFFSSFAVAVTVTLGCLLYLAILSWPIFLITAAAIVIGTAVQAYARTRGVAGFAAARDAEDELQKSYRAIAEGAKELRINRPRRMRVFARQLQGTADQIAATQVRSINIFVTARAFGTALFFVVIGLTLALRTLVWPDSDPAVTSGFVLVLLFMRGPVEQIVSVLPSLGRAQVALRRIADLSDQFSTPEPHLLLDPTRADEAQGGAIADGFRSIELCGATYAFPAAGDGTPFALGPIDLTIRRGEIVFIVGENGCGKTTLVKLLLGLYAPQGGQLLLNGAPVTPEGRDDYRQHFTTVFTDYYLFEDLLTACGAVPGDAERYLERLEVAHKVSVKDGVFSTTDLSTGQRKRLALLNAWIEGRPVLVFDEWAADQDPTFRRIFYTELLPDLQRIGKTIIVISHDDRYFDAADTLVRLKAGRIDDIVAGKAA